MSVSVSAAPFLLISALTGIISATAQGLSGSGAQNLHLENEVIENIFNQEFQTQIVDKRTLLKTLKEHRAINIQEAFGNISCDCEKFHLEFIYNGDKPYTMKISANNSLGVDDLVNDIGSEYCANAQEISYNKIKERLEKQNLTIDDEEIYDDNTIVLTINLDN